MTAHGGDLLLVVGVGEQNSAAAAAAYNLQPVLRSSTERLQGRLYSTRPLKWSCEVVNHKAKSTRYFTVRATV